MSMVKEMIRATAEELFTCDMHAENYEDAVAEALTAIAIEAARQAVAQYQSDYAGHTPFASEIELWREKVVAAVMGDK